MRKIVYHVASIYFYVANQKRFMTQYNAIRRNPVGNLPNIAQTHRKGV